MRKYWRIKSQLKNDISIKTVISLFPVGCINFFY